MSEKLETLKQASKKLEALRPEIREGCMDEKRAIDVIEEAKNVD